MAAITICSDFGGPQNKVGCINIYKCCVFLLDWSLHYYVVSFLISCNLLYFKVYFIWYEDCCSSFLLLTICMEYIFLSSHFQSICVFRYEVGEGNGNPLQYFCLENPWKEEPGRLQSMGSLGFGHDWATSLSLFTFTHWRGKWQPTPVFLPGESQGRGSLVGCRLWGRTESDTTEAI